MGLGILLVAVAAGLAIGVLSGVMGISGGYLLVATTIILLGLTQHQAQGVALAVVVPTALSGAYAHWRHGNVRLQIVVPLASGAIVGGVIGAWLALQIPGETLKLIFGLMLLYFAVRFLGVEEWLRYRGRRLQG